MLDSEKEKAMGRNRKTYSESFKKQVAIEVMDGKKTVAEIAASNNIAPGMVSAWKKSLHKRRVQQVPQKSTEGKRGAEEAA